ncbi:hypothetical protein Hanom_Chr10g00906391 [Helianthus anomalus]
MKPFEKVDSDALSLEHIRNVMLVRLQQYKKIKKEEIPSVMHLIDCLKSPNYLPPPQRKWRHEDSESGDEGNKWKTLFINVADGLQKRMARKREFGAQNDEKSSGIFTEVTPLTVVPEDRPKTIYLCHDTEEGEFVHNYTREEIAKLMGLKEDSFTFDFEQELNEIDPEQPEKYMFKDIPDENDLIILPWRMILAMMNVLDILVKGQRTSQHLKCCLLNTVKICYQEKLKKEYENENHQR